MSRTHWYQDGSVRAWCPDCDWREHAETMATLNRRVNEHVETTGHRVQLYRSQWKAVMPEGWKPKP